MVILSMLDLPKLANSKQKKGFWIFVFWFALAMVYGELYVLKVHLPSLNRILSDMIR
jgi:hypothetical protein